MILAASAIRQSRLPRLLPKLIRHCDFTGASNTVRGFRSLKHEETSLSVQPLVWPAAGVGPKDDRIPIRPQRLSMKVYFWNHSFSNSPLSMRCGRFEGHSCSRGSDSLVNRRQSTDNLWGLSKMFFGGIFPWSSFDSNGPFSPASRRCSCLAQCRPLTGRPFGSAFSATARTFLCCCSHSFRGCLRRIWRLNLVASVSRKPRQWR